MSTKLAWTIGMAVLLPLAVFTFIGLSAIRDCQGSMAEHVVTAPRWGSGPNIDAAMHGCTAASAFARVGERLLGR